MKRFSCYWLFVAALGLPGCASMGTYSPLFSLERALIYRPAASLLHEHDDSDVTFTTPDGVALHGRFYDHPERKAVILFCHGNAGSVESWTPAAIELQQRHGCAVFLFDYRGYGNSLGTPSEEGLYLDARAARRWLAQRANVAEKEIVILGRSLGGGVAVDLASQDGARGLILENTFSSLPDVAVHHVPWIFPQMLMTQRFNSVEKIKQYPGPLLQCHGDADRLIPLRLARTLCEAAPGPKRFIIMPDGHHNDPPNAEFQQALDAFLTSLPGS